MSRPISAAVKSDVQAWGEWAGIDTSLWLAGAIDAERRTSPLIAEFDNSARRDYDASREALPKRPPIGASPRRKSAARRTLFEDGDGPDWRGGAATNLERKADKAEA